MGFASNAAVVRTRFNTEFPLVRPTVPIAWDNVAFTPTDGTPFVRLTVVPGQSVQASLGSPGANLYRDNGVAIVQVFVPIGQGDGLANEIADDIATIFRSQTVSGVRFRTPSTTRVGVDGAWWQFNVTIPFNSDLIA